MVAWFRCMKLSFITWWQSNYAWCCVIPPTG